MKSSAWAVVAVAVAVLSGARAGQVSSGAVSTHGIAFNPVSKKVYAVDLTRGRVAILDTATQSVTHVPVGSGPVSLAVNARTGRVYVANADDGTVSVLDAKTNAVAATLKIRSRPYFIAVNSETGKVYVTHTFSDRISVIDGITNAVTELKTGSIDLISVDSIANTIYLLGYEGGSLAVLDGATLALARREAGKHAWGMDIDEPAHTLYVARMGTADVIAMPAGGAAPSIIPAGRAVSSIAVNSRTHRIYAGNYSGNSVTAIDGNARRALATVAVGERPQAVAVDERRNLVYVANTKSGTVTVIDGATNKALANVPAGESPYALAVAPGASKVYVANGSGPVALTAVDIGGGL
ncbi:MAG: YncE family protein [Acidobacteriota bacterium]